MTIPTVPVDAPRLHVQPEYIDLGYIDSSLPKKDKREFVVTIKNLSGGVLAGKIVSQLAWISVDPTEFRVAAGGSSQHQIRIHTIPTNISTQHKVYLPNLLVINSNSGSKSISGQYFTRKKEQHHTIRYYTTLIMGGFIIITLLVIASLLLANVLRGRYSNIIATRNVAFYYTQAVETIIAAKTPSITPSPYRRTLENQATQSDTQSTQEAVGSKATYTPFPIDDTHNPIAFISDYFEYINEKKLNQSWECLTNDFQDTGYGQQGADAYQIYLNEWADIDKVLVVSAYLSQENVNPAPITITLQYIDTNGITVDDAKVYWVVYDDILNQFLISDIQ